ncbi:MAG: FAD-dependent oxidoreductase [Phycisphaerae bacterium]|nr:FAD-dependent oxidoreductase [Phycisphaerae bacterium]
MSSQRIVIVGGVAGGASAATRARRLNERAQIVMFERGEHVSFANCGLPYHVGGQIADRGKLLLASPRSLEQMFNIKVHTRCEVLKIDRATKHVEALDHQNGRRWREPYDKLILAPGASPVVPQWSGIDCPNVFSLRDVTDMDRIKAFVDSGDAKRAVVIGAGYIGIEMVEALRQRGLVVTLIEQQDQVLPLLDVEMARQVEKTLRSHGVEVLLAASVDGLKADDHRVTAVRLADRREVATDLVLVSIGVRPNTRLAEEAGLTIGESGAIAVNAQMLTSDPDIYAVGDAAEAVFAVTGEPGRFPLAGPANRNGRNAGGHAAAGRSFLAAPVAGTSVLGAFGMVAGMTGLSVKAARRYGVPADAAYALRGHHVGYYPGAEQMILKLVYDPESGRVLGGQAVGGAGVDKRIDVIATVVHFRGTVDDLAGLDLAYAPPFGAAKDPVHIAAFGAQNKREGLVAEILPGEEPIGDQLVDVRSEQEFAAGALAGAINIPLPVLRQRMDELDRSRPVMLNCGVGERSYKAARILMQSGFREVYSLAGGYRMHRDTWKPLVKTRAAGSGA